MKAPSDMAMYWQASIRYELTFVRRAEKALERGEEVDAEWLAGHRAELQKARDELAKL